MNERNRDSGAPETVPPSIVFDLDKGGSQVSNLRPTGTVVLLLSGPSDRDWAALAAAGLSARWASEGRRIVLADLHLESPLLRRGGEQSELEGLVDIFLYGASLSRIATAAPDGPYYLIPVGTYAPDAGEIYRHARWKKLVAGFRDTNATLLLFAPAESPDLPALAEWSSEAILLGSGAERAAGRLEGSGIAVLGTLTPVPGAARAAQESAAARLAKAGGGANGHARSGTIICAEDDDIEPELPPPTTRRRTTRRGPTVLLLAILLLAVLGAAFYLVATLRPDLLPEGITPGSAAERTTSASGTSASMEGEMLVYSVQVKAFTSLAVAHEEMIAAQRRVGTTIFFISPEEIQGVLYYRVLAGLAADTIGANRLRDRLVQTGTIEAEDALGRLTLVQYAPMAFLMGEFATRQQAEARSDSLMALQIPTYPVAVPYSDGTRRWQLLAGAYRDSSNADRMGEMLAAVGAPAQLSPRVGFPVTFTE